jgi:hypothetical protein
MAEKLGLSTSSHFLLIITVLREIRDRSSQVNGQELRLCRQLIRKISRTRIAETKIREAKVESSLPVIARLFYFPISRSQRPPTFRPPCRH